MAHRHGNGGSAEAREHGEAGSRGAPEARAGGGALPAQALAFLLSTEGRALLAEPALAEVDEARVLALTTQLRRRYPPEVVAAALQVALLRQKARAKFARAGDMFFTREALEQASAEVVAQHTARRFAGYPLIADLCCGIGGDTLALAAHARVVAVDRDALRLRLAVANAGAYGVAEAVAPVAGDVGALPLVHRLPFWADPSRRRGERRVFSLHACEPPLAALLALAGRAAGAGIKLAPGVDYGELAALLGGVRAELEFVSVGGELREAVLWLGELAGVRRRATLLPEGATLTDQLPAGEVPVAPPRRYLYEPDAAVIRAHLVEHLAAAIGASKVDPDLAYLTADGLVETPFAQAYRIDEALPFSLKHLNRRLQALDVGELVIKKRGFAVDPEALRRRLKYGGSGGRVVVVLTRLAGRPMALLCQAVGKRCS